MIRRIFLAHLCEPCVDSLLGALEKMGYGTVHGFNVVYKVFFEEIKKDPLQPVVSIS